MVYVQRRTRRLRPGKTIPYSDLGTSLYGADPEIQERTRSIACSCSGGRFPGRRCALHHLGCPSLCREQKSEKCCRKGLRGFVVAFLSSHYAFYRVSAPSFVFQAAQMSRIIGTCWLAGLKYKIRLNCGKF